MGNGKARWWLVPLAAAALVVGCIFGDDDGDGATPPSDLTGWWEVAGRPAGGGSYQVFDIGYAQQVGNNVYFGEGPPLILNGTSLTGTMPGDSGEYEVINLTATQDSIWGTGTQYNAGGAVIMVVEYQLTRRAAPSGTLTASGAYNVNSTTAYGTIEYYMGALDEIEICHSDAFSRLELEFDVDPSFGTGPYDVGLGEIGVDVEDSSSYDYATSGTVTVNSFSPAGISGSYSLTLGGGGSVSGSFNVSFEVVENSP